MNTTKAISKRMRHFVHRGTNAAVEESGTSIAFALWLHPRVSKRGRLSLCATAHRLKWITRASRSNDTILRKKHFFIVAAHPPRQAQCDLD